MSLCEHGNIYSHCATCSPYQGLHGFCTPAQAAELDRIEVEQEASAAPSEKPERFKPDDATRAEVAEAIDEHPLIASLLYDIDLLPEQIRDGRRYNYMLAVIEHMKAAQSATRTIPQEQAEDLARWLVGYLGPLQRDELTEPAVGYVLGQVGIRVVDSRSQSATTEKTAKP